MFAGLIVLEALILTAAVVVSLTAYTYWAAKQGHDFSFLGPILFASIMVLFLFGIIQVHAQLRRLTFFSLQCLPALKFRLPQFYLSMLYQDLIVEIRWRRSSLSKHFGPNMIFVNVEIHHVVSHQN